MHCRFPHSYLCIGALIEITFEIQIEFVDIPRLNRSKRLSDRWVPPQLQGAPVEVSRVSLPGPGWAPTRLNQW